MKTSFVWSKYLAIKFVTLSDRSLFIAGGGGARIWVVDHLIFRRTKGGISRDWETKRGDHWKLWKDSEGDHSSLLGKSRHWGGGERESHQILLGGSLQWSNIQRGDRLNFTLFSLKSSLPPPAINNERSLSCPISLTFNFKCYFVLLILIYNKIRLSLAAVCLSGRCKNCSLSVWKFPFPF